MEVKLWPLVAAQVPAGGVAVSAAFGPFLGGFISNPYSAADQGIRQAELLFVDLVGPAAASETATTVALPPGGTMQFPAGFTGTISVNAATSGHRYSGVVMQPVTPVIPFGGVFPPASPTVLTKTIPSYLYQEYSDDEDLQAFVSAYNQLTQEYVNWFVEADLSVYTGSLIVGTLLDWVAQGLYGLERPTLPSGLSQNLGMLNTVAFNTLQLNKEELVGPPNYYSTSDDIFKRVLTWHLWRGDDRIFDVQWLKRRIMRFLTGENGGAGQTDVTYPVSVTFGTDNQVNINIQSTRRYATGGALFGVGAMNGFVLNDLKTRTVVIPVSPIVPIFKAAVDAGVIELPFQYSWIVNVN